MVDLLERPISGYFANLFDLRWVLGRYGYDPCDEVDVDILMGLPDGLRYHGGQIQFQCRVCDEWSEWPVDIADFDIDDRNNVCGGSPLCCP